MTPSITRGREKAERRWSPSAHDLLSARIASLWAEAAWPHEIVERLCAAEVSGTEAPVPNDEQIIHPRTGKPYSKATIHRIIRELREKGRQFNAQAVNARMGRAVAGLMTLYRRALRDEDFDEARRCLKDITAALGGYVTTPISLGDKDLDDAIDEALAELAACGQTEDVSADTGTIGGGETAD